MEKIKFNTPFFWKSGGIGLFITAIVWSIWAFSRSPIPWLVPAFGLVIIINGILFFMEVPEKIKYWALTLVTANYLYLTTEAFCNLAVYKGWIKPEYYWPEEELGVPIFPYFDRECSGYDNVRGFRWRNQGRATKIANGNLVFDHAFKPNNKGYISNLDYTFKKNDSTVFRWMVLGDSFTDGYYLETPWVDKTNFLLKDSVPHELYSFGINGGGILNWNSVFFNEIVPNYEYDGIVIAIFGNDLARDFFIMDHSSPWAYFGWKGGIIPGDTQKIEQIRPLLDSLNLVKNKEFIEGRLAEISGRGINRPNLFLLTKIVNYMRAKSALQKFKDEIHKIYSRELAFAAKEEDVTYNMDAFKHEFGPNYAEKLSGIMEYANSHNKKIIFATVPELPGLQMSKQNNPPILNAKIKALAENFNVNYFDGYNAMQGEAEDSLWELFLTFDGHWSQKGSDLFAKGFAEYLRTNNDSLFTKNKISD